MSGRSATCRSYDQSSAPSGSALASSSVLPPLKRPISATALPSGSAVGEPVQERRLVELKRDDPVAELVRGEEERQVLEALERLRPLLDGRVPRPGRIAEDGGVDEVLADARPPCGAERPLHEVAQHGRMLLKRAQVAPRLLQPEAPRREQEPGEDDGAERRRRLLGQKHRGDSEGGEREPARDGRAAEQAAGPGREHLRREEQQQRHEDERASRR